ncbi:MAG: shikimate kinase [bacterium]
MTLDRPILLWGMTGAGKSTVAPLLAARCGVPHLDLDARIEQATGRSITALWRDEGEAGFRRREAEALEIVIGDPVPRVVALGGGALLAADRRRRARAAAWLVVLTACPATLVARLAGHDDRPLLAAATDRADRARELAALYARRSAAYADADLVVATDHRSPEQVVDSLLARLHPEAAA